MRVGLLTLAVQFGLIACESKSEETSSSTPVPSTAPSGFLKLTPEELSRTVMEVIPVARGQFRAYREFPATIQPSENELAEVTTLIRGRVVKVHVDVGRDVKKNTLLAMLHSTDLGLAEGAYLKARAKLHEAELVYERAKDLYQDKAVSLAELQRREAEMRTAQAEARETQNRLEAFHSFRKRWRQIDKMSASP